MYICTIFRQAQALVQLVPDLFLWPCCVALSVHKERNVHKSIVICNRVHEARILSTGPPRGGASAPFVPLPPGSTTALASNDKKYVQVYKMVYNTCNCLKSIIVLITE